MGQMAVCCQNLMLGALNSRSVLSLLVDAVFKKLGLCLNMPHTLVMIFALGTCYPDKAFS